VNDGKMCGGVNAARVQHARVCPGMIANGLPENDGSRSETEDSDKSVNEIGSGKRDNVPD
jgi:hypothetical protein